MSKRPLNVLQILPNLNVGGVERGTVQMTAALVARGHKAFVVSGNGTLVKEIKQAGGKHLSLKVGQKSPLTLFLSNFLSDLLKIQDLRSLNQNVYLEGVGQLLWRSLL